MDLIQQYISGSASATKEVKFGKKRMIKEASGGKIFNTLEIVAKKILFKTSLALYARDDSNKHKKVITSVAHTLVSPLLKRLQEPYIHTSAIRKVKECLNRILIILSQNINVEYADILPFLYM